MNQGSDKDISDKLKSIHDEDMQSSHNKSELVKDNTTDEVSQYIPNETVEVDENFKAPDELLKAQSLANLLDTAVKLPFINFRVGLDSLVGLIPGIGDTIMLMASLRILYLGNKMNVPKPLQKKMLINSLIDYGLGFFPIVGDIIDLFFKANQRNVRIIEQWWVAENKDKIDALAKKQYEEWQKAQDQNN